MRHCEPLVSLSLCTVLCPAPLLARCLFLLSALCVTKGARRPRTKSHSGDPGSKTRSAFQRARSTAHSTQAQQCADSAHHSAPRCAVQQDQQQQTRTSRSEQRQTAADEQISFDATRGPTTTQPCQNVATTSTLRASSASLRARPLRALPQALGLSGGLLPRWSCQSLLCQCGGPFVVPTAVHGRAVALDCGLCRLSPDSRLRRRGSCLSMQRQSSEECASRDAQSIAAAALRSPLWKAAEATRQRGGSAEESSGTHTLFAIALLCRHLSIRASRSACSSG